MIGAAATALTALRLPPRVWDSLYYEDGWLFLGQWRAMGASSIVEGYGGYLHTIPRLASGVVHALPVTWWGVATTAMACLLPGMICAALWVVSARLVSRPAARAAVSLVPALTPSTGDQVVGNLNCFHIYCLVLLSVMACSPPDGAGAGRSGEANARRAAGWIARALAVVLLVTTEIQAVVLAPVIAWLALRRLWRSPLVVGWVLGIVAQLATMMVSPRPGGYEEVVDGLGPVARGLLINTALTPITSDRWVVARVVEDTGWAGLGLGMAALTGVCLWAARAGGSAAGRSRPSEIERLAPIIWLVLAVVLWIMSCLLNGGVFVDGRGVPLPWRWGVAGSMLVTIAVLVAVDRWAARRARRRAARAALAVLAVIAVGIVMAGFHAPLPIRIGQEPWSQAVRRAGAEGCADPAAATVNIPQWPTRRVVVACERIRR